MASVRASIVNQARMAASSLTMDAGAEDADDNPVVEQLLRCARLSENADQTLEWALHTLRAHGAGRADHIACQLLRAARARLATSRMVAPAPRRARGEAADARSLAWV